MQYLLLLYTDPSEWAQGQDLERVMEEHKAFTRSLVQSRKYVHSNALEPAATATTVRIRNGNTATLDGPFAETREQLGGYYLVEARDLDEAIAMAGRIPDAKIGSVEIRPVNIAVRTDFEREGLIPRDVKP